MKMLKSSLLCIMLLFVLLFTGCSGPLGSSFDEAYKYQNFEDLFNKSLDETGYNIDDISIVSYQSPDYVKYYTGLVKQYMRPNSSFILGDTDNYIMSLCTYNNKAMNVVFDADGIVVNTTSSSFVSSYKIESEYTAMDVLNTAVDFLNIDYSDIWILQASVVTSESWRISIGVADKESDDNFVWLDDVLVNMKTLGITHSVTETTEESS